MSSTDPGSFDNFAVASYLVDLAEANWELDIVPENRSEDIEVLVRVEREAPGLDDWLLAVSVLSLGPSTSYP